MPSIYLLLFSLYWAQGLPVGFMTHALPVILRSEGLSLAQIGGFGLLMLPWSLKVLWAPWVDRSGHYRAWIIPTQLGSVLLLLVLAFFPPQALVEPHYLWVFFLLLLSINTLGATQDIASDGLAVNQLSRSQQQWGNTLQVIGSRLGFIVGGGAVLWCLDIYSWQITFMLLAGLVMLNTLPILCYPPRQQRCAQAVSTAFSWAKLKQNLAYFYATPELKAWLWVLLSFKLADGFSGPVLKPLMVDLGLSLQQIGLYITMLGAVAALIGAGLGGLCLKYCSRGRALLLFSLAKVLSLWAYAQLAAAYTQGRTIETWVIYSVNAAEDAVSSMLLVVMLTLVMQYSRPSTAGTDFTLQVALMATVSGGLYSVSGLLAQHWGYAHYLYAVVGVAVLSLIPMYRWMQRTAATH